MIKGLDVTKEPLETKRYIPYIPEQVTLGSVAKIHWQYKML
jgi:hypothetical protein